MVSLNYGGHPLIPERPFEMFFAKPASSKAFRTAFRAAFRQAPPHALVQVSCHVAAPSSAGQAPPREMPYERFCDRFSARFCGRLSSFVNSPSICIYIYIPMKPPYDHFRKYSLYENIKRVSLFPHLTMLLTYIYFYI